MKDNIKRILALFLTFCFLPQPSQAAMGTASIASGNAYSTIAGLGSISLPKTPISLDFQDADIRDVLHLLALKSGYNMIYGADVTGTITIHLDQVPFDEAFMTVLSLKGLVALANGKRILRVITSSGLTSEQSQAATFTKIYTLNYISPTDAKGPLDAIRAASGRKGVSTIDQKNNALIITDTQEGLRQVEEILPLIDKKPKQVDIEAKIVEVSLSKLKSLGISWAFARSAGENKFGSANYGTNATQAPGTDSQGGSVNTFIPTGSSADKQPISIDSTGLNFSFLHAETAYILASQLNALAQKGDAKVLSNPHVVTLNSENATINVVTQTFFQTTTVSNGVSQANVQSVSAGVSLEVRPTINADGRITLKVRPSVSNAGTQATLSLPPPITNRSIDTTLIVRDGETIAIGGLISENKNKTTQGVPFLMSIPILGNLFKTTSESVTRSELIVFITPRVAGE